jgi:hypothetical protein
MKAALKTKQFHKPKQNITRKRGDNLSSIASKYDVAVAEIKNGTDLEVTHWLRKKFKSLLQKALCKPLKRT